MWGYQRYYQISIEDKAKRLFEELNNGLFNQVFILGILDKEEDKRHPICLEPEPKYCGYTPNFFENIREVSDEITKKHLQRNIEYSDPKIQEQRDKEIYLDSLRLAIERVLNSDEGNSHKISFSSMPKQINGYFVFTILQLNRKLFESYYILNKKVDSSNRPVLRNFPGATIHMFLNQCFIALNTQKKFFNYIDRDNSEILRTSGRRFMDTIESGAKGFGGLCEIYDACHNISSLKYEGEEGKGKIIVCKKDHPSVCMLITLEKPIELINKRAVRKLLQISEDDKYLISDGEFVFGLGEIKNNSYQIYKKICSMFNSQNISISTFIIRKISL